MELHFSLTLCPRRIIWVTLTFSSIWAKRTRLIFAYSYHLFMSLVIAVPHLRFQLNPCQPADTKKKTPVCVWQWRGCHTVQKMQLL